MAAKSLQLYVSDSGDEAELEDVDAEKPTRKYKCHNYVLIQTITGFKSAENTVKGEVQWRYNISTNTNEGRTVFYNCKKSKTCPVKLKLLYRNDASTVVLYKTPEEHDHELQQIGIPVVCKEKINEIFSIGVMKPKAILQILRDSGLLEPTTKQLSNYLRKLRLKNSGIAIRQKRYVVCPEAKTIAIGQKRKRGRPAFAKQALLVQ